MRGWSHNGGSPLVWRELVDTGGKGLYLGGLKEFQEYAIKYYNITPSTDAELESKIAAENLQTYQQHQLEKQRLVPEPPVRICLTNAVSPLCYYLACFIATGAVFGANQKVAIHLYHSQPSSVCDGLAMELHDLASPLLEYVSCTTSLQDAFEDVSLVYVLDYPYTEQNLELFSSTVRNKEVVSAATLFHKYTSSLELAAKKDVKVVVSGCFANTGAAVMATMSPLPPSSFVASPCLAESQARAVLGNRLKLNSSNIQKVAIWGMTHGPVMVDSTFTRVSHYPGAIVGPDPFNLPLNRCEFDIKWLAQEFPKLVTIRHSQLDSYKEEGPAMVESLGLAQLGHHWVLGAQATGSAPADQQWQSVGVVSDGTMYNIPKGLTCSVPCQCKEGKWELVPDLDLSQDIKVGLVQII